MASLMHDSPFGQLVRYATKGRIFGQPENASDFVLPWKDEGPEESDRAESEKEKEAEAEADGSRNPPDQATPAEAADAAEASDQVHRQATQPDVEQQQSPAHQTTSHVLRPKKTPEGVILIDWYRTDDPANPQNFSFRKKLVIASIINLYTFGVYSCSAIITPAHGQIMERFNVSYAEASLTLSMYVIGYGIGPLVSGAPQFIALYSP
jgi:MFS transporter, DHA1 family, multidrug resistance protein